MVSAQEMERTCPLPARGWLEAWKEPIFTS
jgi:hypothetical protein